MKHPNFFNPPQEWHTRLTHVHLFLLLTTLPSINYVVGVHCNCCVMHWLTCHTYMPTFMPNTNKFNDFKHVVVSMPTIYFDPTTKPQVCLQENILSELQRYTSHTWNAKQQHTWTLKKRYKFCFQKQIASTPKTCMKLLCESSNSYKDNAVQRWGYW